jgi:ADP-ribose pyrophosphatase
MKILARRETRLSPWVTLVERTVQAEPASESAVFHCLKQADYLCVLAVTADQRIPLVRQFRPTVEQVTVELPGGLLEPGEDPARAAAREMFEETGYASASPLELLGCLKPDTGRLENRLWCFFASDARAAAGTAWSPEEGVEPFLVSVRELFDMVSSGQFDHALNVAAIGLALAKGKLKI